MNNHKCNKHQEPIKGFNLGNVQTSKYNYTARLGFNKDNIDSEYRYLSELGKSLSTIPIPINEITRNITNDLYFEYKSANNILVSNVIDDTGVVIAKSDKVACSGRYIQLDIMSEVNNPSENVTIYGIFTYTGVCNKQLIVDNRSYSVVYNDNNNSLKLSRVANTLHFRYLISKHVIEDGILRVLISSNSTLNINGHSSLLITFGCTNIDDYDTERLPVYNNQLVNNEISSFPLSNTEIPPLSMTKKHKHSRYYDDY